MKYQVRAHASLPCQHLPQQPSALDIAEPLVAGHHGRAAVDAVAPLLLLGWGQVGPKFLRHLHAVAAPNPAEAPVLVPVVEHLPNPLAPLNLTPEPVLTPSSGPAPAPAVIVTAEPAAASVPTKRTTFVALPAVPEALLTAARCSLPAPRRIAETHHAEQGEHITPGQLKARLGVTLPLATAAHAQLSA